MGDDPGMRTEAENGRRKSMITIIAMFELKPECIDTFKGLAAECIEASRKEEGNVDYRFYTGKDDKNKYFFVEVWKDEDAIKAHNASTHFQKFASAFMPMLDKAPVIEQVVEV